VFLILLLAHPHLLEGAAGAENAAADPGSEALLRRRDHLHTHVLGRHIRHLLLQAVHKSTEARVTSRDDDVLEEIAADVDICLANGVDDHVLHTHEPWQVVLARREHLFHNADSFAANLASAAIGKLNLLRSDLLG